ncbi:hypothetical protein [Schlesneria sp. DSM 10557]|uniref:hypothetical protein n=1 Tax=Schlesneria sp. DSM 10557 TaxID=3044399 RepID=UPI0035A13D30
MKFQFQRKARVALALVAFVSTTWMYGCGKSGPPRYEISGTVTVDGIAVPSGTIGFFPDGIEGPAAGGQIADGFYKIKASQGPTSGSHKVEIRGFRESGKPVTTGIGGTTVGPSAVSSAQKVEMYVPDKFNSKTTLKYDVEPTKNEMNFDLKTH